MSQPAAKARPDTAANLLKKVEQQVGRVIRGKPEAIRLALTTLLARGHLLIEDVPGVGKTTLARTIARTVGGTFRRIQFTSDLLPSDILGVTVYQQESGRFEFRPGPIFANVVLADEINRTTPRTQSALLEAMSEGAVSIDDATHELTRPFFVIATQNPHEHYGTYPLPESQMDRFLLRVRMGYPAPEHERNVLKERGAADPLAELEPAITHEQLTALQDEVEHVKVDDALVDYAMAVVGETRRSQFLSVGVSTRGALAWYRAAQAHAFIEGRNYLLPDDLKDLAVHALAHRVVLASNQDTLGRTRDEAERALGEILARVPIPL
jgi:MoxR-like ATPase